MRIPKDFPVQPLKPGEQAKDRVTCGTCGRSWDDAISTSWTPAPSGRCPFEYFHAAPRKRKMRRNPIGKHRTTVGSNTDGMTCVRYHSTDVICFNDKEVVLRSGGWLTATTKKRINQTAEEFNLGFYVKQTRGHWWVVFTGEARPVLSFEDGIRFPRNMKTNPRKRRSKKKPSPAQLAARKKFIKMVRARAKKNRRKPRMKVTRHKRGTATRYKFSRPVPRTTAEAMIAAHKAPRRRRARKSGIRLVVLQKGTKFYWVKHNPHTRRDIFDSVRSKAAVFSNEAAALGTAQSISDRTKNKVYSES